MFPSVIYLPGGKGYVNGSGEFVAMSVAQAMVCCCGTGTTCSTGDCTYFSTQTLLYKSDIQNRVVATGVVFFETKIDDVVLTGTGICGQWAGKTLLHTYNGGVEVPGSPVMRWYRWTNDGVGTWTRESSLDGVTYAVDETRSGDCNGWLFDHDVISGALATHTVDSGVVSAP